MIFFFFFLCKNKNYDLITTVFPKNKILNFLVSKCKGTNELTTLERPDNGPMNPPQ